MNKTTKIIIAIVGLILIGWAVYANLVPAKNDEKLVGSTDVTDWKTYTNEKLGFGFKYPADLFTKNSETNQSITLSGKRGSLTVRNENVVAKESDFADSNGEVKVSQDIAGKKAFTFVKASAAYAVSSRIIPLSSKTIIIEFASYAEDGPYEKSIVADLALQEKILSTFRFTSTKTDNNPVASDWKTYTDTKVGYSFDYPAKLTLASAGNVIYLHHEIPFENRDGGCDMKGDSELSKKLTDFNLSIEIVSSTVKPPYVDGTFSKGALVWDWAYMGAEGCGQTKYYFPMKGNRTVVITKNELQILSPVVTKEVRDKVLAVPGVISYEESQDIVEKILSTFKFN